MKKQLKKKIEDYILENEGGVRAKWTDKDVLTTFGKNGEPIDDYIITIEDGDAYYSPVSMDCKVTLLVE